MKKIIPFVLLTLCVSLSTSLFANDAKHHKGKTLHEQKCTSCHGDKVYSRKDRMVKTMSALENQVGNCMQGAAKAEWTNAQTTSVIEYLNDQYYKF